MFKRYIIQATIAALSFTAGVVTTNLLTAENPSVLNTSTLIVNLNDKIAIYGEFVNGELSERSLRSSILDLVDVIGSEMEAAGREPSCEESWSLYSALKTISGRKEESSIPEGNVLGGIKFIRSSLSDVDRCSWFKELPGSLEGK